MLKMCLKNLYQMSFAFQHRARILQNLKLNVADFQSVEFSKRAEILLVVRENVFLKLNRQLQLINFLLSKIPSDRKIPLTGNWPLFYQLHRLMESLGRSP